MKHASIPSFMLGGPENPSMRLDSNFLLILGELLNPKYSDQEAAELLERDCAAHRVKLGDVFRAANSKSAVEQLAAKLGTTVTERIRPRFEAIFRALVTRHKDRLGGQISDLHGELEGIDRRFQAEALVDGLLLK